MNVLLCSFFAMSGGLLTAGLAAGDLRRAGIFVICMILAIGVHEFSHAYAAHRLGDPTPEGQGRLTLNPIAHMDPIGTLALPLILGLGILGKGFIFGWGRPVQTNPRHYTRKVTMRSGMALVAFAGPLSNLLLAIISLGVVFGLSAAGVISGQALLIDVASNKAFENPLTAFYYLNILLFAFNLLPFHPLDGGKVLAWLLGSKYQHIDDFLMRYGFMIVLVLVFALPGAINTLIGPFFAAGNWALAAVL
ncbi:MAG: site-2 protease family protein [Deltaproteobacteria bacterium]|nr:site-2 protease family protein [Deltaproteobacteria bacterium]